MAKIGGGSRRPAVRVRDDQLAALSAQPLGAHPHREGPGAASAGRAALLGGGQGEHVDPNDVWLSKVSLGGKLALLFPFNLFLHKMSPLIPDQFSCSP